MYSSVWEIIHGSGLQRQILNELQEEPDIGMVELFVSDNCPLACRHCFHADVRSVDPPLQRHEWVSVIDQLIYMGVRHFHLAGREPFTEKITLDLLAYLSAKKQAIDLRLGAISNGLNCRKHLPTIRESALDYLEISIDGLADTHDWMRGKGTYRRTVENLEAILLVLGEQRVSVATALSRRNIAQIPALIESLSSLGVRRFFFQPIMPMGYALSMTDHLIGGEEYRQAILWTRQALAGSRLRDAGVVVMFYIPAELLYATCQGDAWIEQELLNVLDQGTSLTRQGTNYLQFDFDIIHLPFWQHLIITEDGYLVSDCASRSVSHYRDLSVGSVRHQPLPELISKAQMAAVQRLEQLLANRNVLLEQ